MAAKAVRRVERVEDLVREVRGHKVLLDSDLASLYGVSTSALNQAVKRHMARFPVDFMFRLNEREFANLKSQSVTSSWGGRRKPPYAFTEQGVAMLSSVLNSEQAVNVNMEIMRAFVRMRKMMASHIDLARRIDLLEAKYDKQFKSVFDALRELILTPEPAKRRMGFRERE